MVGLRMQIQGVRILITSHFLRQSTGRLPGRGTIVA